MGKVDPVKNIYRLQSVVDKSRYHSTSQEHVNRLVESGKAEWVGTDWDEDADAFVHYVDRVMS